MRIGVLAFQGDVSEHVRAAKEAAKKLGSACEIIEARDKKRLEGLDGLIIPGGESTTLFKLCEREGMLDSMRRIPKIFGTCAGAIMLAKKIHGEESGQKTLGLMDIEIDRNAYGRQSESFEQKISTKLGAMNAIFIRAPRIRRVAGNVVILAERDGEVLACEQFLGHNYYLAACFHPELTTTAFHERFLGRLR
ncbi:MAG: pyridoxal 5'-phosphate synthase glutaminase subunit PdxT [Candidatus Micrarchaeota archaeon]